MSILAKDKTDFREARDHLAGIVRDGGPFVVQGNGSSRIGLARGEALTAPEGAWDYDPSALTLTVAAGVSVETVAMILAQENQRLAFEPPEMLGLLHRTGLPTIGGMVAGNLSGPRRVGVGGCRDFCLGVEFIDGRGHVIKNGGRVMKNVTGLDLVKLMAGSHGTLGLMTEVSLKTQPVPEVTATLEMYGLGDAEAIRAMSAALGGPFDVTGAAHLRAEGNGAPAKTLIRLEGFESSVKARGAKLQALLATFGDSSLNWNAVENAEVWRDIRDVKRFWEGSDDVWRVSVKPSEAAAVVEAVQPEDAIYDWGGNRLWLRTAQGTDVRDLMPSGHATLIRSDDETKRRLGVFPRQSPAIERISAGLRKKFDPQGKFNQGMMG